MRFFKKIIFTIIIMIVLSPNFCHAENEPFYIGFSCFSAMEQLDSGHAKDKFINPVSINFDDSVGLQFRFGAIMNEYLSGELSLEYVKPFSEKVEDRLVEVDVINSALIFKGKIPLPKSYQPYALFGVGVINTREDIRKANENTSNTDWGGSSKIGAGIEFFMNTVISINLEASHTMGFGNVDHIRYSSVGVGLTNRF